MTQSSQTTQQSQNSTSAPWAPSQPLLQQLLGSYGGMNTSVTGAQSAALGNLQGAANAIPNFGAAGSKAVNGLFNANNQWQRRHVADGVWQSAKTIFRQSPIRRI